MGISTAKGSSNPLIKIDCEGIEAFWGLCEWNGLGFPLDTVGLVPFACWDAQDRVEIAP